MAATNKSKVQRGAKLLDEKSPGWAYKVRISKLDLAAVTKCIIGQVFTEGARNDFTTYTRGLRQLGLVGFNAEVKHGFNATDGDTFPKLTELWKDEVRKRRGKSGTRSK